MDFMLDGLLQIRIQASLKDMLKREAVRRGTSLPGLVRIVLAEQVQTDPTTMLLHYLDEVGDGLADDGRTD